MSTSKGVYPVIGGKVCKCKQCYGTINGAYRKIKKILSTVNGIYKLAYSSGVFEVIEENISSVVFKSYEIDASCREYGKHLWEYMGDDSGGYDYSCALCGDITWRSKYQGYYYESGKCDANYINEYYWEYPSTSPAITLWNPNNPIEFKTISITESNYQDEQWCSEVLYDYDGWIFKAEDGNYYQIRRDSSYICCEAVETQVREDFIDDEYVRIPEIYNVTFRINNVYKVNVNECPHFNHTLTTTWADDCSSCRAEIICQDCGHILLTEDGTVTLECEGVGSVDYHWAQFTFKYNSNSNYSSRCPRDHDCVHWEDWEEPTGSTFKCDSCGSYVTGDYNEGDYCPFYGCGGCLGWVHD